MSKAVAPRSTILDSERYLTNTNLFLLLGLFRERNPQTVPFKTQESQNRLRSQIWAGVSRSRGFHEGPKARFPLWKKQSTSLFQAVNQKTRPFELQLARAFSEKGGRNFFLTT